MLIVYILTAFLIIYLINKLWNTSARGKDNLPPGPKPLPLIENVHQLDRFNLHLTFDEWKREFGEIVSAKFFGTQIIVLNSSDVVKEALIKQADNFSARPKLWIFSQITGGVPAGYINTDGWLWKEQRRYALHILRDFGLGRSLQEEKIEVELHELFEEMEKSMPDGKSADLDVIFPLKFSVVNIINNILFGKRFKHGNPEFVDFSQRIQENFANLIFQLPLEFLPFLRIFKRFFKQAAIDDNVKVVTGYILKQIEEHKEKFAETMASGAPTDFVYAYLQEVYKREKEPDQTMNTFSELQLCWGLGDLFVAGYETTATTISWFYIYMAYHEDVQEKMREEVREQVGTYPAWADRVKLPYCSAVIAELQRLSNIVPMGVFHSNFEETKIKGYTIPQRSMVVVNHWSVMRDEALFDSPTEFIPERFLDSDGSFKDKQEGMIPFSVGKRSCLGEGLARMELFMFTTSLVFRYRISAARSGLPGLDPIATFTLAPKPFEVNLTRVDC